MIPLTAPLPLRLTSVWGTFATVEVIPIPYGRITSRAVRYSQDRTVWCWADCATGGVDAVTVNGQPAGTFSSRNDLDVTGHPVTLIQLAQPVDADAVVMGTGRGRLHPTSGALIENPGVAVWDILTNIAGNGVSEGRLAAFSREATRYGLTIAGTLRDAQAQAQAVLRDLCGSVGARFAPDAPGMVRLYPGAPLPPALEAIDYRHTVSPAWAFADLLNDLSVNFDFQDGSATQSLQVDCPDLVARYGRRPTTVDLPWVNSPRVAYDVAARLVKLSARPCWNVTASGLRARAAPLDPVRLDHDALPLGGVYVALSRVLDTATGLSVITFTVPTEAEPAVRIVRQSEAFAVDPVQITTQNIGSDRVLTLHEQSTGGPMVGASVTVDAQLTRTTDASGAVRFPAAMLPPGPHTLDIVTADGRTMQIIGTVDQFGNFNLEIFIPPAGTDTVINNYYYSG